MKAEGLKNEHELQSYFVRRIEKFINAHHRTLLGWSEIREGGLAKNAAVMVIEKSSPMFFFEPIQ